MKVTQKKIRDRQEDLLSWYDQHKRDLPWRHTTDPYAIWVSEIMLQQTRVETVLPYYETFLSRFPTVEALAGAEVEEVLGAWSGLGYYRRARLLHQAARQIVRDSGRVPRDMKELLELPGIGAYTAAAIGSMAFGLVEPAIDGNVERVISRYLGIDADPKRGEARRQVLAGAGSSLMSSAPETATRHSWSWGRPFAAPADPAVPVVHWVSLVRRESKVTPKLFRWPVRGPHPLEFADRWRWFKTKGASSCFAVRKPVRFWQVCGNCPGSRVQTVRRLRCGLRTVTEANGISARAWVAYDTPSRTARLK